MAACIHKRIFVYPRIRYFPIMSCKVHGSHTRCTWIEHYHIFLKYRSVHRRWVFHVHELLKQSSGIPNHFICNWVIIAIHQKTDTMKESKPNACWLEIVLTRKTHPHFTNHQLIPESWIKVISIVRRFLCWVRDNGQLMRNIQQW